MSDLEREEVINRRVVHDRPGRSFVEVEGSRWGELIRPSPQEGYARSESGLRLLAVTSYAFGRTLLGALIERERARPDELHLVAVATDDAANSDAKIGLHKRLWRLYPQPERVAIETATIETALQAGVPVYTGEMKIAWFYDQLARWRPEVIVVCGCGQIFDSRLLGLPRYGVYNFHPSDLAHGHGAGAQPYADLLARNDPWTRWTVHRMTEEVDAGPIVGQSPKILMADANGLITRDIGQFCDKMSDALGPMAAILTKELVRLRENGRRERLAPIDFGARMSDRAKVQLAAPIA
jgi:folate-dependent phosphoribosylglycinamide formyltransferase PurN